MSAWDACFDDNDDDHRGAIGVDSMGDVVKADKPCGDAEKSLYRTMMKKW